MAVDLFSAAARAWLREHALADPAALLLAAHRWPALPVRELVGQVAARQKARHKLPTWAANEHLLFPPNLSVEQASSEATARFKAALVVPAASLADLTGGFAVDALHFAQTVARVTYVERQAALAAVVAHNAQQLGAAHLTVVVAEAEDWLAAAPADSCAWLYLDPARRDGAGRRVAALADCAPNVVALLPELLRVAPRILLKTAPLLDIQAALRQLGGAVARVWVVEAAGEVKEVLYELWRAGASGAVGAPAGAAPADVVRCAVGLAASGAVRYEMAFTEAEEAATAVACGPPEAYLFEPAPAVLKAGALKLAAARFGLRKLHPNTQLYTGPVAVAGFPGRQFRVRGTTRYHRAALRALLPEGRASITARNFPGDDVPAIRKKLALADGGALTVFATTGPDGKPLLVVAEVGEVAENL